MHTQATRPKEMIIGRYGSSPNHRLSINICGSTTRNFFPYLFFSYDFVLLWQGVHPGLFNRCWSTEKVMSVDSIMFYLSTNTHISPKSSSVVSVALIQGHVSHDAITSSRP
jgi:hypothetical protein